jgi:hypothetical protein
MDYLKLFQTHQEYEEFVSGDTMVKPNVSHCISENEVHYNPLVDPRLIVKYNVADASNPTKLYRYYEGESTAALLFDKVEIDGTEVSIADLDAASGKTQFSVGEHTVKYTLKNETSIEDGTFWGVESISNVSIPSSVTTIGMRAFNQCLNLTSVNIPNSVATIRPSAFSVCVNLESITLPNNITNISNGCFALCGLTSVTIPNSVTSIGTEAFEDCSSLTSVTIPNSVVSIGSYAFCKCPLNTSSKAAVEAINPNATECRGIE